MCIGYSTVVMDVKILDFEELRIGDRKFRGRSNVSLYCRCFTNIVKMEVFMV